MILIPTKACIYLLLCIVCMHASSAFSQPELKLVEDETSALLSELGGSKNAIKRATLTKEDERMINVSLTFTGFDDKNYRIKAQVLNQQKKPIEEITPVELDMPKSKQAEITLQLSDEGKTVTKQNVQSKFLLIRTAPKDGGLAGLLDETMSDINLTGNDFLFELNKNWMAMGANVKVTVTLTPYKNAASISPN